MSGFRSMKILIQQGGTSRELKGGFTMMGNKSDLCNIARQILEQARQDEFYEGWIEIRESVWHPASTAPIEWHAPSITAKGE